MSRSYMVEVEFRDISGEVYRAAVEMLRGWAPHGFEDNEPFVTYRANLREMPRDYAAAVIRALRGIPGLELTSGADGVDEGPTIVIGLQDLEVPMEYFSDTDDEDCATLVDTGDPVGGSQCATTC